MAVGITEDIEQWLVMDEKVSPPIVLAPLLTIEKPDETSIAISKLAIL